MSGKLCREAVKHWMVMENLSYIQVREPKPYKMAYNSTSTIAGLKAVLTKLIELPTSYLTSEKRAHWIKMLEKIPAISFREKNGFKTIAPAWTWARINNQEIPQLYPVFPFGLYGVGLPRPRHSY